MFGAEDGTEDRLMSKQPDEPLQPGCFAYGSGLFNSRF